MVFSITLSAQQIYISNSDLYGTWNFNTLMQDGEGEWIKVTGDIDFKSNETFVGQAYYAIPVLSFLEIACRVEGEWQLVNNNRIVYTIRSITFPQIPEAYQKYTAMITHNNEGRYGQDKVLAFDKGILILQDSDEMEIVYKRGPRKASNSSVEIKEGLKSFWNSLKKKVQKDENENQ